MRSQSKELKQLSGYTSDHPTARPTLTLPKGDQFLDRQLVCDLLTPLAEREEGRDTGDRNSRALSDRFHRRMSLTGKRLSLEVQRFVRADGCDDRAWPHAQAAGAAFMEALADDPRWMLGGEGKPGTLAEIACGTFNPPHAQDLLLTLGLGGAAELPSHRLIQTIDPFLALASRINAAGFGIPMMRIFKADTIATEVNHLECNTVAHVSAATLEYIRRYTKRFYPQLDSRLSLCTDEPAGSIRLLVDVIRPMAAKLDILPEMAQLGQGRSSATEAMAYGVAHAFYMGALLPPDGSWGGIWRGDIHPRQPRGIICIGGKPERLFIRVMNMAAAVGRDYWRAPPRLHLITRLAQKPAYLCYPDEPRIDSPVSLEALKTLTRHPRCGADWKAISKDGRLSQLIDFMENWND